MFFKPMSLQQVAVASFSRCPSTEFMQIQSLGSSFHPQLEAASEPCARRTEDKRMESFMLVEKNKCEQAYDKHCVDHDVLPTT